MKQLIKKAKKVDWAALRKRLFSSYRYYLTEDYTFETGMPVARRVDFFAKNNDKQLLFVIEENGNIRIKKGFAWDGCSPKLKIVFLGFSFFIGTPDGAISRETGRPYTYYASLVHDALKQFADHDDMPFSDDQIDFIFLTILERDKFHKAHFYYDVVVKYRRLKNWFKFLRLLKKTGY